jgi:O-methyltransferase involved in polyketide biosynthesis
MPQKLTVDLGNVQKTMLLPLWGRAVETQKQNPLLVDQTAADIIGRLDYDFASMAKNLSELSQVAWIVRSLIMDKIIREFLEAYPAATVVNIGCGLDTTFDRVDNGTVHWYDLDLPDVIQLRSQLIPEGERRKFLACSFLDESWIKGLSTSGPVFFMAAGVLYYFEECQVKEFFHRLADAFPGSEIVFDASSPMGVRTANKMVIKNSGLDERSYLKWGLNNAESLAAWDSRIHVVKQYPYFHDTRGRLHLSNQLWALMSDAMRIQYIVHLKFD